MQWRRKSALKTSRSLRKETKVTVCMLLDLELFLAQKSSKEIPSQLSWNNINLERHLENWHFFTTLLELPLSLQIMNLFFMFLTELHLITLWRMLPLERKRSMRLSWKKYHFLKLWTTMRDRRFPRLSKMLNLRLATKLSQRDKQMQQTCISYWKDQLQLKKC